MTVFQIIQINSTVLISVEELVVSEIPKNKNHKSLNIISLLVACATPYYLLFSHCGFENHPWTNIISSLYRDGAQSSEQDRAGVLFSVFSLWQGRWGQQSQAVPVWLAATWNSSPRCSYKKLSGRSKINIILNSICKRRNVNMYWIDLCFLRMKKKPRIFF